MADPVKSCNALHVMNNSQDVKALMCLLENYVKFCCKIVKSPKRYFFAHILSTLYAKKLKYVPVTNSAGKMRYVGVEPLPDVLY